MTFHDGDPTADRAGRRGNGLHARAYTPLAELDPRVADAVLDALRSAGVAAYAVPSPGSVGGYLEVRPHQQPTVRVWVDAAARATAQSVLAAELPPGDAPDEDAAFRSIVAWYDAVPSTPVPPWPVLEDVDVDHGPGGHVVRPVSSGSVSDPTPPGGGAGAPGDPVSGAPGDEEHFVPPPPPPLPRPRPVTAWAWLALLGGVALLVVPTVAGSPVGPGLAVLAVLAVLGGFATLVARLRDVPPTDSGPDDGAVV